MRSQPDELLFGHRRCGADAAGLLILAGLAGFLAAWFTYNQIRSAIAALSVATRLGDGFGGGSETDFGESK